MSKILFILLIQIKLFNIIYIMAKNVIFSSATYNNTYKSKHKIGRVDLLSKDVADELNTYRTFGVFRSYANTYAEKVDKNGNLIRNDNPTPGVADHPGTPGVRSIFNKYSAVLTGNTDSSWESKPMDSVVKSLVETASSFRISNNIPLLDTPETRKKLKSRSGCSVRELVQKSRNGYFGRAVYSYSDFMYCKYLGKVSNNYLITLRRFPAPVLDSILPIGIGGQRKNVGKMDTFSPIGTMVTWLGVSGNDMKNILKYSYSMSFQEKAAEWNTVDKQGGDNGILNGLEAAVNKNTRALYASGTEVPAISNNFGSFFNVGTGFQLQDPAYDQTKVYGPIDRVKKAYTRGTDGLDHIQSFQLVFEYELRAYNGINPKQAMLDLLASIFSVTYTTGNFWGGGYNSTFIGQSSAFSNLSIFKCNGGFTDFMDAFIDSAAGAQQIVKDGFDIKEGDSLATTAKKVLNGIGGMLMGGLLNKLGRPARYFANSLISDAPVGLWHITIGNPNHPIMSLGNMILKSTEIEHSGPLGLDDFPTNLKVTCTFDRGKPRDQRGLEAMYMSGNDRIFHSMEGAMASMYNVAAEYKHASNKNVKISDIKGTGLASPDQLIMPKDTTKKVVEKTSNGDRFIKNVEKSFQDISNIDVLNYYFGDIDAYAILSAANEQGKGMAFAKKVETNTESDSNSNNTAQ